MSYYMIDKRDRIAQRVTANAPRSGESRFVFVEANSLNEAFERAGVTRGRTHRQGCPAMQAWDDNDAFRACDCR